MVYFFFCHVPSNFSWLIVEHFLFSVIGCVFLFSVTLACITLLTRSHGHYGTMQWIELRQDFFLSPLCRTEKSRKVKKFWASEISTIAMAAVTAAAVVLASTTTQKHFKPMNKPPKRANIQQFPHRVLTALSCTSFFCCCRYYSHPCWHTYAKKAHSYTHRHTHSLEWLCRTNVHSI